MNHIFLDVSIEIPAFTEFFLVVPKAFLFSLCVNSVSLRVPFHENLLYFELWKLKKVLSKSTEQLHIKVQNGDEPEHSDQQGQLSGSWKCIVVNESSSD